MFKKIVMSLLVSSSVFAGSFDFYTNTSKIYFDVFPTIPEMRGLFDNAPDGGIAYIMSEASGKDYCWLKTIDSNGVKSVSKFYVDWTNGKYTPETYGRIWNDMCKVSKRKKKFVNTDLIISLKVDSIRNYYNREVIYVGRDNLPTGFDFYFIEKQVWEGSAVDSKWLIAKMGKLELRTSSHGFNKNDSVPFFMTTEGKFLTTEYIKSDLCNVNELGETEVYNKLAGVFLRRLIADGFLMISCDQ